MKGYLSIMNSVNTNRGFFVENNVVFNDEVDFREALEFDFDCWFSNILTEIKQDENGVYYSVEHSIDEVAEMIGEEELAFMCYSAGWFEEVIFKTDKRNAVYWYALHLLYLYNESIVEEGKCPYCDGCLFNYEALFTFLNGFTPF